MNKVLIVEGGLNLQGLSLEEQIRKCQGQMTDVSCPAHVEVAIRADRRIVWVNVNGVCMFRACDIQELSVDDRSQKGDR